MKEKALQKPKQKKAMSNYTILLIIIGFVYILSMLVPSGSFQRVNGNVDPSTFTITPKIILNPIDVILQTPKTALSASGSTIIAMIVVGGAIGVITENGALDVGINVLMKKFKNKVLIIIPLLFAYFGALGMVGVMTVLPFIPLGIELARRLKVDNIFAVAVLALGAYGGFMASPISSFSTAVAQDIAHLPIFSGAGLRFTLTIVLLATMAAYLTWYAARVRKNPANSVLEKIDFGDSAPTEFTEEHLSKRQALSLVLFFSGFILFSICATKFKFGTSQLAGIMLPVGILCGLVSGFDFGKTMNVMVRGAARQMPSMMVMILAAGITTILSSSGILDSIVYYLSQTLIHFNSGLAAVAMFIVNSIINFAIPSGSAQAATVMPIMTPMSDVIGVSRQVAVLAYQLGDGYTNLLNPANGALAACLALTHTNFKDWLKLILPVYGIMFVECCVALLIAVAIGWC